jgi:hypothetical protein
VGQCEPLSLSLFLPAAVAKLNPGVKVSASVYAPTARLSAIYCPRCEPGFVPPAAGEIIPTEIRTPDDADNCGWRKMRLNENAG